MNHQPRKPFLPSNPNAAAAAASTTSSNFRDSLSGLCLLDVADPLRVFSVSASDGKTGQVKEISYTSCRIIGNGSFGIVFYAKLVSSRPAQEVAIKRVLQDKRYKNRELQIMRELSHPNIVALHSFFYSSGEKNEDVYLNLVLDYMPETVHKTCRHYAKAKQFMPLILVKLYTYQLLQALAYLHGRGYCHRDIKPQNLLVNPQTGQLKLCDFGSAKRLSPDEANVSYICSRYYRAPELIFGATHYTNAVDIWSTGCVVAELMLGQPIFPGESGMDQLVEIIKVLGTPNKDQVRAMNPNYVEHTFPQIGPHPLAIVFRHKTPASAIQFISQLLQYAPQDRPTAQSALSHAFFDELRAPDCTLPNGASLPAGLFDESTSVN